MIHDFDDWTASLSESGSLTQLSESIIGIDAAHFLDSIPKLRVPGVNRKIKEELTVALGGYPLGYRAVIQQVLTIWRELDVTPLFVFSGIEVGTSDNKLAQYEKGEKIHADGWRYYDGAMVDECLQAFGNSISYTAQDMFGYFQQILREEGVKFMTAPYSAWAQLAYLQMVGAIDTVAGASELFLYDIPEIITQWDFASNEFSWVKRRACMQDLANINPDLFVDACLLAGCALLPTLPQLDNPTPRSPLRIRGAADLVLSTGGKGGYAVCLRNQNQEDPQFRALNYLDRFVKARLEVKHHVVVTKEGRVESFRKEEIPNDMHEIIGQRLPEELYFYLSKGIIGSRALNWVAHAEHLELPPLDNGEAEEYRKLVRDQLTKVRTTCMALLSSSMSRFFQHNAVKLRCWFDKENAETISVRGVNVTDLKAIINSWNVPATTFNPQREKLPKAASHLSFAILSLQDTSFAAKTIRTKDKDQVSSVQSFPTDLSASKRLIRRHPANRIADLLQPLISHDELLLNSLWRALHLRGYMDSNHKLTAWGEVLATTVAAISSAPGHTRDTDSETAEAALIAVELLRLDLLSADNMFHSYSSLGFAKTETDRRNVLLVSRVASLAKLQHKQIGFSGALSRHLLGYNSIISAVRRSLRDLVEVSLTTLLLNGDASRDRADWTDLGLDLPFLLDQSCAMGLAMNIYLNRVLENEDPKAPATHQEAKEHSQNVVFVHAQDFAGDIERAFGVWDAVYAGVKKAGDSSKFGGLFDEVNTWLADLR